MRRSNDESEGAADAPGSDASNAHPATPARANAADAVEIQALLTGLSQLRLSLDADLSAAAGALDSDRSDIAAELVSGAREDLAELQHAAWRRELQREAAQQAAQQLVATGARQGSATGPVTDDSRPVTFEQPPPRRSSAHPLRRPGRILATALALVLAVLLLPHLSADTGKAPVSGLPSAGPAVTRTASLTLVSAEFTALRTTLQSPHPNPSAILAAGRKWHSTVSNSLAAAANNPTEAREIVTMLRLERTVISTTPRLRSPQLVAATSTLTDGSNSLFGTLRNLATAPVRAAIPTAITVLPTTPAGSPSTPASGAGTVPASTPSAGPSPATPVTTPDPQPTLPPTPPSGTGTGTGSGTATPSPSTEPTTVPVTPAPVSASPQPPLAPLPSTLGNLAGSLLPGVNAATSSPTIIAVTPPGSATSKQNLKQNRQTPKPSPTPRPGPTPKASPTPKPSPSAG